jgi:hypothetical protein
MKRKVHFGSNTSWTVPSGVFYVEATVCGGGGGSTNNNNGVVGNASTAAHSSATITGGGAAGLPEFYTTGIDFGTSRQSPAQANTGYTANFFTYNVRGSSGTGEMLQMHALPITGGLFVSPGDTVTITIGAGGSGGHSTGGSGYVDIEYEVI